MKAEPIGIDVGGRSLRISSPAKVMFPAAGVTKEELVRYYIAVGDGICAALRDRPTTLRRFPDGIEGEAFFQKRVPAGAPDWVQRVRIQFPSGRSAEEICPTEPAVFAWRRIWARWSSTRGRSGARMSTTRTSCGSTSTRSRARHSPMP